MMPQKIVDDAARELVTKCANLASDSPDLLTAWELDFVPSMVEYFDKHGYITAKQKDRVHKIIWRAERGNYTKDDAIDSILETKPPETKPPETKHPRTDRTGTDAEVVKEYVNSILKFAPKEKWVRACDIISTVPKEFSLNRSTIAGRLSFVAQHNLICGFTSRKKTSRLNEYFVSDRFETVKAEPQDFSSTDTEVESVLLALEHIPRDTWFTAKQVKMWLPTTFPITVPTLMRRFTSVARSAAVEGIKIKAVHPRLHKFWVDSTMHLAQIQITEKTCPDCAGTNTIRAKYCNWCGSVLQVFVVFKTDSEPNQWSLEIPPDLNIHESIDKYFTVCASDSVDGTSILTINPTEELLSLQRGK